MIQIIIGIAIVTAAAIVLAVFHKKKRTVWRGTSVCFAAVLAAAIVMAVTETVPVDLDTGLYFSGGSASKKTDMNRSVSMNDESGYIDLIQYLVKKDDIVHAKQLLNEYSNIAEYSPEYMNLVADVYDAGGNPERASTIRKSLNGTAFEINDKEDPDNEDAFISANAFYAVCELSDNIKKNGYYSGEIDEETLYKYMRYWLDAGAPYSDLPSMNRALLAAELYLHDYTNIANDVMSDPDGDTLIIASQLIRNGKIDAEDITDAGLSLSYRADQKELLKHIEAEIEKEKSYSEAEIDILDEKAEAIRNVLSGDSDILSEYVIDAMNSMVQDGSESAAKICLELADIAYSAGDDALAAMYVEKSLSYASMSTDREFSAVVEKINEIMFKSDDPEERKLLSEYVDQMIHNRMPEGTPDIDTSVLDNAADMYEKEHGYEDDDDRYDDDYDDYYDDDRYDDDDDRYSYDDRYDDDREHDGSENDEAEKSLNQNINDTLNQISGSINIVSINAKDFPSVTAVVAADSNYASTAEEFKANMAITDAEVEIEDYEVEKIDYKTINVILVCDVSGSMSGASIQNLREAVKTFAQNADANVNIGIVPFSSGVKTDLCCDLGSSKEKIIETASKLNASGGTNILDAVNHANTLFPQKDDELNIMILMSDGNDSLPSDETFRQISTTCLTRGITIYTVGLGNSVDAVLMEQYASYGGGEYFYVNSPESIASFYNFIYNISKNRFRIKYDAADTYVIDRRLEVSYTKSASIYSERYYSLFRNDIDEKLGDEMSIIVNDVVINGIKERMVYYSDYPQNVTVCGNGFSKDAKISVELKGSSKYDCETEFQDEQNYKVKIPAKVPDGIYDVYIKYNGKQAVFPCGFLVSSGDTNVIRFGDYVFTASTIEESADHVKMSGLVQLNGWLGFKDPVTLTGDTKNDYDIVMEYGKTFMQYTDTNAGGLAGFYAKYGYSTKLPTGGKITLYNDQTKDGSSDDYPVQNIAIDNVVLIDFIGINNAGLAIYPDRAVIDFKAFNTKLPFQEKIISSKFKDAFAFTADNGATLIYSKDKIDCSIQVKLKNTNDDKLENFKLGNMSTLLKEFELTVNTLTGSIELKGMIKLAGILDGIGLEIGFDEWKLDKLMLLVDKDITASIDGVNITVGDFKLGLNDLSNVDLINDPASIFNAELVGGCKISLAKVSSYWPGIEKFVGDVSLFSLDDVEHGFRLKEPRIRLSAKTKFLDLIEIGYSKYQLGFGLEFDNPLFTLQNKPNGFIGEVGKGPKIDTHNLKLDIGASVNLAVTDQIIGIGAGGKFNVEISWWVFVKEIHANGDVFIGAYRQHNGKWAFAAVGSGQTSNGKNASFSVVWGENDGVLSSHKF